MSSIHDMYNAIVATLRRFHAWQQHPFKNENLSACCLPYSKESL